MVLSIENNKYFLPIQYVHKVGSPIVHKLFKINANIFRVIYSLSFLALLFKNGLTSKL